MLEFSSKAKTSLSSLPFQRTLRGRGLSPSPLSINANGTVPSSPSSSSSSSLYSEPSKSCFSFPLIKVHQRPTQHSLKDSTVAYL